MKTIWTYHAEKFSAIEHSLVQCLVSGAGGPLKAITSVRHKSCSPIARTPCCCLLGALASVPRLSVAAASWQPC